MVNRLELKDDSKLLDLCCGYGKHAHAIATNTKLNVTGIDLSEDYIKLAKVRYSAPNARFEIGDMRDIPYENYFDAVVNLFTSFGFFEKEEENIQVIKEIYKALKPGGKLLLDFENKFFFVYNDVFNHEKEWKEVNEKTKILLENKYDVIKEREIFLAKFYVNEEICDEVGYNIRL